jgi:hypothetical protein
MGTMGHKGTLTHNTPKARYFDKSSAMISTFVNTTWFSQYPCCQKVIYDNGSEFKHHFKALCDAYGIKRKPTSVKNPQANAILEHVHKVIMVMLCTVELDMADSVSASDINNSCIMRHVPFALPTIQYLKPLQGQHFFVETCCFTSPSLLTGKK